MTRWLILAALCAFSLGLTGCGGRLGDYRAPVVPPQGLIMTDVCAPLTVDFDKTPVCTKEGTASTYFIRIPVTLVSHWLTFGWGEADIKTAAAHGGLKTIAFADYQSLVLLGVFGRFTVKAYGE
jgi:hypothetical protein